MSPLYSHQRAPACGIIEKVQHGLFVALSERGASGRAPLDAAAYRNFGEMADHATEAEPIH